MVLLPAYGNTVDGDAAELRVGVHQDLPLDGRGVEVEAVDHAVVALQVPGFRVPAETDVQGQLGAQLPVILDEPGIVEVPVRRVDVLAHILLEASSLDCEFIFTRSQEGRAKAAAVVALGRYVWTRPAWDPAKDEVCTPPQRFGRLRSCFSSRAAPASH